MPNPDPQKKLGALAIPAEAALGEFLQLKGLQAEQWQMRLSVNGQPRLWRQLTADSGTNDRMIREEIELSQKSVTDLVLAFVGMIEWRGSKRLLAHLQYFRSDYTQGLMCLRYLKEVADKDKFEAYGNFLIVGACQNRWI
jgi:hypothetical protein